MIVVIRFKFEQKPVSFYCTDLILIQTGVCDYAMLELELERLYSTGEREPVLSRLCFPVCLADAQ